MVDEGPESYEVANKTSYYPYELEAAASLLKHIEAWRGPDNVGVYIDHGDLKLGVDGEIFAAVWWDGTNETWRAQVIR